MLLKSRIKSFISLGNHLKNLSQGELDELSLSASNQNSWFTHSSVSLAISGIADFLEETSLLNWVGRYPIEPVQSKKVGVIAAGNIPLVCFHDIMSVLIAGHDLMIKPSSDDTFLVKYVLNQLVEIDQSFDDRIHIVDRLNDAEAYIATGSDNSARYFKFYFKNKPNLIRSNRSSVAVIIGEESDEELCLLGKDVFQYFGLGCRNVSKVLVPIGYDLSRLLDNFSSYLHVGDHHKYVNNYDYNKSIYLVNGEAHLDNGFLLLKESEELVSPISVLYYEYYDGEDKVAAWLSNQKHKIQCIVGSNYIPFGQAQAPEIDDYADGVDTMEFLISI